MLLRVAVVEAIASELARRDTGNKDTKLGHGWWRGFRRRNPDLAVRSPRSLEEGRAKNTSPETLEQFYNLLEKTIADNGIEAATLWNVDEKGFSPDPKPRKVVASKTARTVNQQHRKSHDHITANICINAAGNHLPPQLIYNRKTLATTLTSNGPPSSIFCTSTNGSMDKELFLNWFKKIFLPHTSRERPQLVLMDNHSSHISIDLIDSARKNNVIFLALPSKTTHLLQPLDRAVFSSLAEHHQSVSATARLLKPDHRLSLADFLPVFTEAFHKSVTPSNILASFKITGVYPLRRDAVHSDALKPSSLHHQGLIDKWTEAQHTLYRRRVQEGYDLPNEDFEQWKLWSQQQQSQPISGAASFQTLPLADSMVRAGIISQEAAQLFQTPVISSQRLPSAASRARSLTSDEFFSALQQIEQEKRDKNRQSRTRNSATTEEVMPPTPPAEVVCSICGEGPAEVMECPECAYYCHRVCCSAITADGQPLLCPNCVKEI